MEMSSLSSGIYHMCTWVVRLASVNILWMLFSILGMGIFGVMPATVALFSITRKWIIGEENVSVFRYFWETYRSEFLKSNLLGSILLAIGLLLYLDLAALPADGVFFMMIRVGLTICSILFFVVLLYLFPLYVHYDWKNRFYLKNALLLGAAYPHFTITMIIGAAFLYLLLMAMPGMIPFFSVSVLAFIIMGLSYQVFKKIDSVKPAETDKEWSSTT